MDMRKELIVERNGRSFWRRHNHRAQRCAGSPRGRHGIAERRFARGAASPVEIEIGGLKFEVDLLTGKRPAFISIKSRITRSVAQYAEGRRVLDCFTNQGAFALACARAGAAEVTAVEASAENIAARERNAERNNWTVEWIEQDVFQFLRGAEKAETQYDLIILDPPSFTKTKSGLHDAMRGYRELHVRAFKLLSRDGVLATFSCSHHVSEKAFAQMIADALVDARRSARRLRRFEQALDHPVAADFAGDGIFQRRAAGDDAGTIDEMRTLFRDRRSVNNSRAATSTQEILNFGENIWHSAVSLITYGELRRAHDLSWQKKFDRSNKCWN